MGRVRVKRPVSSEVDGAGRDDVDVAADADAVAFDACVQNAWTAHLGALFDRDLRGAAFTREIRAQRPGGGAGRRVFADAVGAEEQTAGLPAIPAQWRGEVEARVAARFEHRLERGRVAASHP